MVNGNQNEPDSTSEQNRRTGNTLGDGFRRRSFLRLTGAAAAGAVFAGRAAAAPTTHHVEIVSTGGTSETGDLDVRYELTATGEIVPDTDNGRNSAERNDSVTENDDGTWTATGTTGNGFGDAYTVTGRVVEFTAEGSYELYLDGTAVAAEDLVSDAQRRTLEVLTTEDPSELDYTITTTGEITPNEDAGDDAAEGNDSVTENDDGTWTADGYTGNGYGDTYYFTGELVGFGPVRDFAEVRVDGEPVDLSQYERTTTTSGSLVGGGEEYERIVPQSEASVVVSSIGDLEAALNDADRGDVVYVAGDATIDASSVTGTDRLVIPAGVTLASNRGIDGAPGGEIRTSVIDYPHMMGVRGDARVTGVRITGPVDSFRQYSTPVSSGLTVTGSGVEIDNVEISGFNYAGVMLRASAHVHHSHIHGNSMEGLGYGVCCNGGQNTLIEYNRFNFNRHCVANNGSAGYEVRYNRFDGKQIEYQVGTHRPGGTTLKIHHNTFVTTNHLDGGDPDSHISIRGVPDDVADIHHNWFHNPQQPSAGRGTESVIQPHVSSLSSVDLTDNHYGADEPAPDIGCPR